MPMFICGHMLVYDTGDPLKGSFCAIVEVLEDTTAAT